MSKPLSDAVAERLRAEMGIAQLKPAELARRLEVSHMYVARRMSGETPMDLNDVERFCRELEIPPARLLLPALAPAAVPA